ncbi:MAG: hypothetical protein Q8J97_04490, partial [Flavobacteriaceae bacterium]|nr:hypothetical protein [Flavobacteriaceae bacterium]
MEDLSGSGINTTQLLSSISVGDCDDIIREVWGLGRDVGIVLLVDEFSQIVDAVRSNTDLNTTAQDTLLSWMTTRHMLASRNNWLVMSGFTPRSCTDVWPLLHHSSREVSVVSLPLIDHTSRSDFDELLKEIKAAYTHTSFPTLMYETLKSCAGLLGLWHEKLYVHKNGRAALKEFKGSEELPKSLTDIQATWLQDVRGDAQKCS